MKTSNRIILGMFLAALVCLVSSHLILRAKWQRKDFADVLNGDYSLYHVYDLPAVQYIKLKGLASCRLFPSDKPKLVIENRLINLVRYRISGDSLLVDGSYEARESSNFYAGRSPARVQLFLPSVQKIDVQDCSVDVRGTRDSLKKQSMEFELDNASLNTRPYFFRDSLPRFYDSFSVKARNNSQVYLYRKDYFQSFSIDLDHSSFFEKNAKIENIHIHADSSSMVVTGGRDYQQVINQ